MERMKSLKQPASMGQSSASDMFLGGSKHGSSRINSVSSRVSARFGFDAETSDTVKAARIKFKTYLQGETPKDEVALQDSVNVRVLKTSPGAAIARWTKFKGTISLGSGRFHMELKKSRRSSRTVIWTFDVGMIKNIGYKRKGAKDFSISFHDNDKLLNVVTDSANGAEKWLVAIFAEIRVQASVFGTILRRVINPTWTDVLRINKIDGIGLSEIENENGEKSEMSPEEEKKLLMDDTSMNIAETCLREEVDLWTLCRGKDHPDVCEAYERLAIWLKKNFRHEESAYWWNAAEKGRVNHSYRMKHEMNPAESTMKNFEDNALDELRNPSGMKPLDKLSNQREQNSAVNMEKRIEEVMNVLQNGSGGGAEAAHDPFEDMI